MDKIRIKRNVENIKLRNKELWEATKTRDFDGVYRLTFEVLSWVVNSDDWFKLNYSGYEQEMKTVSKNPKLLLGLKQAYNSFKHNMTIISVEEKNYDLILLSYPVEQIVWLPSIELKDEKNSKAAFKSYCEFVEGQSVLETLKNAEKDLYAIYKKYLQTT